MVPSKLYDALKWVALTGIPPLVTFILGLGVLLDWDGSAKVAGVIALVATLLGGWLQLNSVRRKNYLKTDEAFDGYVMPGSVDKDTGIPGLQFTVSRHPVDFLNQGIVRLKVGQPPVNPVRREPLPDAQLDLELQRHDDN